MLGGKWGTLLTDGLWALAARDVDACTKAGFQELSWRFYILTRLAPAGPPQQVGCPVPECNLSVNARVTGLFPISPCLCSRFKPGRSSSWEGCTFPNRWRCEPPAKPGAAATATGWTTQAMQLSSSTLPPSALALPECCRVHIGRKRPSFSYCLTCDRVKLSACILLDVQTSCTSDLVMRTAGSNSRWPLTSSPPCTPQPGSRSGMA